MSNKLLVGGKLAAQNFSGKFGEIWAKYPSRSQKLPAPTPLRQQVSIFNVFRAMCVDIMACGLLKLWSTAIFLFATHT